MNKTKTAIAMGMAVLALGAALVASAAGFDTIGYQGRLLDDAGEPVNGNVALTFAIYGSSVGGTPLWGPETQSGVTVNDGVFSVRLGAVSPLPANLFNGPDRWLGVKVAADAEMTPRVRLASVAYAMNSARISGKRVQVGNATLNIPVSAATGSVTITYPEPFLQNPAVTVSALDNQIGAIPFVATTITNQTISGATITFNSISGATATGSAGFTWIAVGE